ncbi:MAG: hypothetical protein AB8B61_00295 [Cyclobacteriaceae bacterium]
MDIYKLTLMHVSIPSLLNKVNYNKRLQQAEKQILKGNIISQEGLENEVENW